MIYDLETFARRRSAARQRVIGRRKRLQALGTLLAVLAILLVGLSFRALNLAGWDGLQGLHPDERYISETVNRLRLPSSIGAYFDSATSPLNPRNNDWSAGFVYGSLPTTITRVVAEVTGFTGYQELTVVGRALSAAFDLITCLTLFFLARLVYGRNIGLLAAALYAVTVMPIQQSHFFTTDNFAVAFATLTLLFATRLALFGRWRDALLAGVFIGAAVASKINLAALGGVVGVAAFQFWFLERQADQSGRSVGEKAGRWRLARSGALLVVAGLVTLVSFRVFQPDAFTGPRIWNIWPEQRFVHAIQSVRGLVDGTVDYPPSHQWASRTPYLWPWQNMVMWGMGLPLGLAAWFSFAVAGFQFLGARRGTKAAQRRWRHLVPWIWVAFYFAWQGGGFNPSLRYFLPIYPQLIMFAAWGAFAAGGWLIRRAPTITASPMASRRTLLRSMLPGVLLLAATTSWAWAFTRIYTQPHTRLAAAEWMLTHAQRGSSITTEQWDDPLPHTNGNGNGCNPFCLIETQPYAEDEPNKFGGTTLDGLAQLEGVDDSLIGRISQADYIVLSSARIYSSVERLPHRFPATLRYYQALFDGSLGFELVADFHSFPRLFGLPIPDLSAEEQFHVYDHPRVLIFRKTERFSPQNARDIITRGVVWDELYRISARITTNAPNALRLTEGSWHRLQQADGRYLFDPAGPLAPPSLWSIITWLLAIEALGLATLGILTRLRLPLPDRGLLSSRFIGLLLFAVPPALIAASGYVSVTRMALVVWLGLFVGFGVRLLWAEREAARRLIGSYRSLVAIGNGVYIAVVAVVLVLRGLGSTLSPSANSFGLAHWMALLRSPVLPPPDPLFAGGHMVVPYAGVVPLATVARVVGMPPHFTFNLALATACGLLVLMMFVVVMRPVRIRGSEAIVATPALSRWIVPLLATLLMLSPGLIWRAYSLSLPGIVAGGNLAVLAGVLLALSALAIARGYLRYGGQLLRTVRGSALPQVVLLGAVLGLLRAHDRWAFMAIVLPLGFVAFFLLTHQPLRLRPPTVMVVTAIGLSTVLIARLFPAGDPLLVRFVPDLRGPGDMLALVAWALLGAVVAALATAARLLSSPLSERRVVRCVAVWLATFGGFGLLLLGQRAFSGQIRGDGHLLFLLGFAMLACAVGWGLPAVPRVARRITHGLAAVSMGVVLVGLLVSGSGLVSSRMGSDLASVDPVSPALTGAIDALARDASGAPIVAIAPSTSVPPVIAQTGLSALIAAPDTQAALRDPLRPSVDTVMAGRTRALGEIYGADPDSTLRQLATYHVKYVLVGPDERVAFGPTAGAALRLLEQRGTLTRVYAQDDVSLFRYPLVDGTPPVVARDLTLRLPSLKTGMLDRPLAELPVVDEYGWNRLANQNWIVAIVLWLVVIQLLGLLALPLSVRIFNRSLGGGWAWSRLVGLIVWCYLIWLPVSLGWWTYQWPSLVIAAFGLVGLSWVVARGHSWRRSALDVAWRDILRFELLFLGSFLLWTLVRAANPDLWHPTLGGEKPFEFGMLNAIVRSPIMPPPDPFFSGGIINYYYYGLFIVSAPIRATGIDPASAFNLIVPLLFALTLTGATAFVRDLTGRWRWGLLAALLVCVLGPVASAFRFGESRGIQPAIDALRPGIAGWGGRLGDWFWGPSRIIPHTINEFPFFSYLFADLHPHMIALPITIMAAAIALQLLRGGYRPWASGGGWAPFCMAALVLGTLAVSNSWDAPTYALVLGGALVGSAWRSSSRTNGYATRAGRVVVASLLAVVLVAAGLLLYLPFFLQFQAMVGGIGQVRRQDSLLQFFAIHGTSLYITLTLLAGIGWVVLQRAVHGLSRPRWRRGVVVLPLLVMAMLLGAWAFAASPAALQADGGAGGSLLRPVLVVLVGMCVLLALAARLRDEEWITLWLISVALMVALGIQIIFVRDHLAGSDWERMNTVFKFGLQIWTLLALAAAAAFPLVLRLLRRAGEVFIGGWFTLLLVLVMAGAVYPLVATPSRVSLRFQNYPGLTLDGLAFMRTARYEHDGNPIELQWDAQAIDWMKENLRGLPVVLQSEAEFYRAYGVRIAANTGFPTVLGRLHQDEQRPAAPVLEREADVRALYSTPDPTTAVNLLAKYQVDYVYVGPAEQNFYDRAGLAKWDDLVGTTLELAYENPGVRLYRVSTDLQPQPFRNVGPSPVGSTASSSPPEPAVAPPPAVDETTLAGLEAAHQARPADGPTAFGLAMMYIQAGRLADAAAVLSSAAPSNRNDIPLHHLLGDIQAQLGRNDEAIDAWRTAADVDPSSGNLSKLGTGLTLLGRYDEAETVLRRALERDPNDMLVHFYLGELAARRGGPDDDDMARQAYTIYLEQAPADSPFRETARQALERLGQ